MPLLERIAVSTRDRQSERCCERCQAECRPGTVGHKLHSITRVQVKRGRPFGLLQDAGGLWIAARRAQWWSNIESDLTICDQAGESVFA